MDKDWLPFSDQVRLLRRRGLHITDETECEAFLSRVNYYRLSGYFRYWQVAPAQGDNRFIEGSSFETIRDVYVADEALKAACIPVLHALEVLLRTRFAHYYGQLVGTTHALTLGHGLTQPPERIDGRRHIPLEEQVLQNLNRSKEPFIAHFRDNRDGSEKATYDRLPIWVAVEALSFGTLSRLIEASGQSGVLNAMAESMSVSRRDLPSQVRSFVYLRNRIAHCARLWNHVVLDKPALQPAQVRRAKRVHQFDDLSVYKVLLALDTMAARTGLASSWLMSTIDPLLRASPLLESGIARPRRFGEMDISLLTNPM